MYFDDTVFSIRHQPFTFIQIDFGHTVHKIFSRFRKLFLFWPCLDSISKRVWSHAEYSAELALNNKDYLFFTFVFGLINSTRSFSSYSPAMAKITIFSMCQNAKDTFMYALQLFFSQHFIATFCCNYLLMILHLPLHILSLPDSKMHCKLQSVELFSFLYKCEKHFCSDWKNELRKTCKIWIRKFRDLFLFLS